MSNFIQQNFTINRQNFTKKDTYGYKNSTLKDTYRYKKVSRTGRM